MPSNINSIHGSIFFIYSSTFSMLQTSASSCNNSTNLQPLSNMNYGRRVTNMESSSKTKSQAQALVTNENGVKSLVQSLQDEQMASQLPATFLEHLTLHEGRLIKGGHLFQQNFLIRSFEIDPHDRRVSTKAIMNYLQEATINYMKNMGMSAETHFGITPEMSKRELLWLFRCMRIEVDRYPSWNDVVQVSHWIYTSGRTGLRFDWIINDINTGETLVRASCLAVMMNKITRKACKLPQVVEKELKPYLAMDAEPIVEYKRNSCPKVEAMDHIQTGLIPGWHDLDFNYHVNNAKYLDWILESVPRSLIRNHELSTISIEYRKECLKDDVIQSLSRVVTDETSLSMNINQVFELEHMLRLENGPEVLRARTTWRPKSVSCHKAMISGKPINPQQENYF